MRKIIATLAVALTLGLGAYADTHSTFQSEFGSLANSLATSLAVDATLGSNWSDAYIGSFPNFGVGVTVGGFFTGADSSAALSSLGVSLPSALANYGLPVPALAGSFKIGLPFLPIDIGVKGMYVPASISDTLLSGSGVGASLASFGIQIRYALVKQTILLPNVSIGAAYNYQQGNISASIGPDQTYYVDSANYIKASSPNLKIDWTGNSFDFTAQVSKQLLFIIPYLGLGATFGSSTVSSSIDSAMTTNYPGGINALNSYLAANGGPSVTPAGFTYSVSETAPIYRLYGGFSLRIFVVDFDIQMVYLPLNSGELGAALTTRIQI